MNSDLILSYSEFYQIIELTEITMEVAELVMDEQCPVLFGLSLTKQAIQARSVLPPRWC